VEHYFICQLSQIKDFFGHRLAQINTDTSKDLIAGRKLNSKKIELADNVRIGG
jgi:hypothetical protein